MQVLELLIILLSALPKGIQSRTALQKLGYFASIRLDINAGYSADLYGPFSSHIAETLQSLVELDFVEEKRRLSARNRTIYHYSLTSDGMELANHLMSEHSEKSELIKRIVNECAKIVHCNYQVLSWAAKVHFILAHKGKAITSSEIMDAGQEFNWTLGEKEIGSASQLLSALFPRPRNTVGDK